MNEELKKLNSKIINFEKRKKEYYLNNSKYIFNYFEDKQTINENKNTKKM